MDGPRGRNSGRRPLAGWHPFEPPEPGASSRKPSVAPLAESTLGAEGESGMPISITTPPASRNKGTSASETIGASCPRVW
jgi:hypothetical protein